MADPSLCNFPTLSLPNPDDIMAAIVQALEALIPNFPPPLPTIPWPPVLPFCPLDAIA